MFEHSRDPRSGLFVPKRFNYAPPIGRYPLIGGGLNPFRGSSGFNALSYDNCIVWLDASDASSITLNGSDVSGWADKSTAGNDLSQATASKQPALTTGGQNGKDTITFDGGSEVMGGGASFDITTFTHFMVMDITSRAASSAVGMFILVPPSGADWSSKDGWLYSTADDDVEGNMEYYRDGDPAMKVGDNGGGFGVYELQYGAGTSDFLVDGSSGDTDTITDTAEINAADWGICGRGDSSGNFDSGGQQLTAELGAILMYSDKKGAPDVGTIRTDLAAEWGVTA